MSSENKVNREYIFAPGTVVRVAPGDYDLPGLTRTIQGLAVIEENRSVNGRVRGRYVAKFENGFRWGFTEKEFPRIEVLIEATDYYASQEDFIAGRLTRGNLHKF